MQFTAEQKSQLAKLMATENLTVEHQKIKTARFDPQNRILYLPIWQNMTGALYDLLCGHEVGHALYTPASGWHDAVADESKGKGYKSFLNVVEDARIEKKVKRKYPGLTKQFKDAYSELMKRDFFGLRNRDINEMAFIERLNLFTKSQYTMNIRFTAQEELYVKKVQECETWEDVVRITDEIYGYSKEEQYEMMLENFQSFDYSDDYGDGDYDEYDSDGYDSDNYDNEKSDVQSKSKSQSEDSDEESDDKNDGDGNGEETEKQSKSKSDDESDGESTDSDDNYDGQIDRYKDSAPATKDMFQPKCETDDSYRANEVTLLDEKCKEYVYLTLPKPNLKNIITPAKRVQEQLTVFYSNQMNGEYKNLTAEQIKTWVSEFKTKNERYVGLLAKEFEMRKAAKAFSKSKLSDTGDIDINKLATYRFDDNIFRKVMLTPKGKNHGLVLLIDKSGSMSNNMAGSIEQILVLAMFCRKVNIPFVVYGFGDSIEARYQDLGLTTYEQQYQFKKQDNRCFNSKVKNLAFSEVYLREYINNKMTNAEFNAALRNMILLKKSYEGGRYGSICGRPDSEHLSNTPLNQAIVATAEVMKKFKATNNLDMTSLVIVHDGDADGTHYYCVENKVPLPQGGEVTKIFHQSIDSNNYNVIVRDNENKFERKIVYVRNSETMTHLLLDWFRKTTGSKVFGFFLIPDARPSYVRGTINHRYVLADGKTYADLYEETRRDPNRWQEKYDIEQKVKDVAKQFKAEKFLVSNTQGFNSFFLVAGGNDLKTEEEEIEIEGKVTANKLKNAFMKMNKKKQINRVLVSKFIQGIAA